MKKSSSSGSFGSLSGLSTKSSSSSLGSLTGLMKSEERKASNKVFKELDKDGSKSASVDEMYKFVSSNDQLWEHLALKTNVHKQQAKKAATRVAMELATGLDGQAALDAEINKDQFHKFRKNYMKDPAGAQEFLTRAIFEVFDKDNNSVLDEKELDAFLDVLYTSGSIIKGDIRALPSKQGFKKILFEKVDTDGDGKFTYEEIHVILNGAKAETLMDDISKKEREDRSKSPVRSSVRSKSPVRKSKSPVRSKSPFRSSTNSPQTMRETMKGLKKGLLKGQDYLESDQIFKEHDKDGGKTVSVEEMNKFVKSNDALWERLALKLDQPPAKAKKAVTRVAMELATGLDGQAALDAEITKEQFHTFRMKYMKDPAGQQEFFYRSVFEIFDKDNNGFLDEKELDPFLDVLYKDSNMFKGDIKKLPPRNTLRKIFFEKLDQDGDRKFHYEEVKSVITGNTAEVLGKELDEATKSVNKAGKKAFKKMDKDGSKKACVREMFQFVAKNDDLWDQLAKQTDQPPKACKKAATRAAMELATGLDGQAALDAELTQDQFVDFHEKYIQSPEGLQEFFYRSVFVIFDKDNSGCLDESELDQFLDILYNDASIFRGNIRKLPQKDKLRRVFFTKLDKDGDRRFQYEEVKSVIAGGAADEIGKEIHTAVADEEYAVRKVGGKKLSYAEMQEMRKEEERKHRELEEIAVNAKYSTPATTPAKGKAQSAQPEKGKMGGRQSSYREFKASLDAQEKARKEGEKEAATGCKKEEDDILAPLWEWAESIVSPLLASSW